MAASVRQYFSDVLESKRNDFRVIKQKTNAWDILTEEFNSQVGVTKRDVKQLKKCWDKIKSRAKKSLAKEKREAKLTGGGKASPVRDEAASAVAAIIPDQVESLENPFDDDHVAVGSMPLRIGLPRWLCASMSGEIR